MILMGSNTSCELCSFHCVSNWLWLVCVHVLLRASFWIKRANLMNRCVGYCRKGVSWLFVNFHFRGNLFLWIDTPDIFSNITQGAERARVSFARIGWNGMTSNGNRIDYEVSWEYVISCFFHIASHIIIAVFRMKYIDAESFIGTNTLPPSR